MLVGSKCSGQQHPNLQRSLNKIKIAPTTYSRTVPGLARYQGNLCSHPGSQQRVWRLRPFMEARSASSLVQLLGTSLTMFLGAYGCGILPSYMSAGEEYMGNINALGAGMLLGSALAIILPEGFSAAHEDSSLPEWSLSLALLAGFWCMLLLDLLSQTLPSTGSSRITACHHQDNTTSSSDFETGDGAQPADAHSVLLTDIQHRPGTPRHGRAAEAAAPSEGFSVGSSDMPPVQAAHTAASSSTRDMLHGAEGPTGRTSTGSLSSAPNSGNSLVSEWLKDPSQQALLGLIIHAAADGLAVGASALSPQPAVSLSIAVAMVVHKGPVAMGLATYLRSAKWSLSRIHAGILLFAAVSPVAAILTYCLLTAISFSAPHSSSIPLAVLFSGGTVLYAATMHILPSALGSHQQQQHCGASASSPNRRSRPQQLLFDKKTKQLLSVSVGMLVPLLLSIVVQHEH